MKNHRKIDRIEIETFLFLPLGSLRDKIQTMEPISGIIFGIICAIVADSRGRSPLGWAIIGYFLPCLGLFILLVIPDLQVMERRDQQLNQENRRLREQIRRDRALADSRHSETLRRIDLHDEYLQVDTATPPALPMSMQDPYIEEDSDCELSEESYKFLDVVWWYADQEGTLQMGPTSFDTLKRLWHSGTIRPDTLVWCELLEDWFEVKDVCELREQLNA